MILVTGSSGFAGEVVTQKLKKYGYDVIGLDWKQGKFTNFIQDISKPFQIKEKIDVIIHLAARLEAERCSKEDFFSTNVQGTQNILKVAKQHNSYFIYISTTAIYGSPESPITEDTKVSPNGYYGLTKLKGEEICKKYIKDGLDIIVVRPSVLIGEKRLGIFKIIFKKLFSNSYLPLLGNGENRISFVNIDDFAEFLAYLVKKRLSGLTVNFGGIVPGTLNQIIKELKVYTRSDSKIIYIPVKLIFVLKVLSRLRLIPVTSWQLSVMHKDYFYDNKALFSTGYKYRYQPIEALKLMADFYRLHRNEKLTH